METKQTEKNLANIARDMNGDVTDNTAGDMTTKATDRQDSSVLPGDPAELLKLARYRMPFGKYSNRLLIDLPEPYVVWFANKGFPQGELGRMLRIVYEIKINGLEYLFEPLRSTAHSS